MSPIGSTSTNCMRNRNHDHSGSEVGQMRMKVGKSGGTPKKLLSNVHGNATQRPAREARG